MNKELLEQYKKENEKPHYEKKEYNTFKPSMGSNYLAVLDQGDMLPFITSHYHQISGKFINCLEDKEKGTCPICSSLRDIWDDNNAVRQSTYREIKKKEKTTLEVVELNADGSIKDPIPKLFNISKTAFKRYFDDLFAGKEGVLVVVKKQGNPYADYSETHIDESIKVNGILPEPYYDIHNMGYYDKEVAIKALNPILKSLGMEAEGEVSVTNVGTNSADDEELSSDMKKFKEELLRDLGA